MSRIQICRKMLRTYPDLTLLHLYLSRALNATSMSFHVPVTWYLYLWLFDCPHPLLQMIDKKLQMCVEKACRGILPT
jgi:hypothetical protein